MMDVFGYGIVVYFMWVCLNIIIDKIISFYLKQVKTYSKRRRYYDCQSLLSGYIENLP